MKLLKIRTQRSFLLWAAVLFCAAALAGCQSKVDTQKEQVATLAKAVLAAPDPAVEEALLHFGEPDRPENELTDALAALVGETGSAQLVENLANNTGYLQFPAIQYGFTSECTAVEVEVNSDPTLFPFTATVTLRQDGKEDTETTFSGWAKYGTEEKIDGFYVDLAPLYQVFS